MSQVISSLDLVLAFDTNYLTYPAALLPEALTAAQAIEHAKHRADALIALIPHLPAALLPEALAAVQAIEDAEYRARALIALIPHLPETLLPEALAAAQAIAQAIKDEYCHYDMLNALAPHLPETLLPQALTAAQAIEDASSRARALTALAPHLPAALLPEALTAAQAIEDEYWHASALIALIPYLPEALLPEVLKAAQAIEDASSRARALTALIPHLPKVPPEALKAAQAIEDASSRADALIALVPHLPEVLPEVLKATQDIKEGSRIGALKALAPYSPEVLPELINEMRSTNIRLALDADDYREGLAKILEIETRIAFLYPDLFPDTPKTAPSTSEALSWVKALAPLIPQRQDAFLEALKAAQVLSSTELPAVLKTIISHVPKARLAEALETAQGIQNEDYRAEVLISLAPYLTKLQLTKYQKDCFYLRWQKSLHRFSNRTRNDIRQEIVQLIPIVVTLGGDEVGREVALAMQDIRRWWP